MRKMGWISTMAAVAALSACNAPDTATPKQESTAAQPSDTVPVIEPKGPSETTPAPQPSASEDGRPPLDNSAAQAKPGSCLTDLGREKAEKLSEQCYAMSPATRPACNVQNSCETIRKELKRGCEFGDTSENPAYCSEV
jgi:hypothetical protein|tara:strand:- start:925 stop:1341 length:417 start_codon:yes stop_codon:yes gene_type:complete